MVLEIVLSLNYTRAMIHAALNGNLNKVEYETASGI